MVLIPVDHFVEHSDDDEPDAAGAFYSQSSSGSGEHAFHLPILNLQNLNPFPLIGKVGSFVTKPLVKIGEIFTIPEMGEGHEDERQLQYSQDDGDVDDMSRMSVEGTLYHRKGRSSKWKRRLVVLKFENGGVLESYKVTKEPPQVALKNMYSQLHRQASVGSLVRQTENQSELRLLLTHNIPWMVRDIENDPSTFVIEIPTDDPDIIHDLVLEGEHQDYLGIHQPDSFEHSILSFDGDIDGGQSTIGELTVSSPTSKYTSIRSPSTTMSIAARAKLDVDFKAAQKRSRPLRLYFQCPRKGNEKTLWLRGFAKLNRLSPEPWHKRKFFGKLGQIGGAATSRIRQELSADFNRDARQLETGILSPQYRMPKKNSTLSTLEEQPKVRREFRVYPTHAYPHVWMTESEMREECNLPSTNFHDLQVPETRGKEIGTLRVEVLQCMGLPSPVKGGENNTVAYLVCGSHAFTTDVIPSNSSPFWLRKARRACSIPIFHGYARLFCGAFHDDTGPKDEFIGRTVIDLSKLRPHSKYDVIIPLRQSAHVYSRRQKGVIRLRFQLDWKDERAALMSYLPKSLKIPKMTAPDTNTTVMCTDPKGFRNIALTVHGIHMPGKFSFDHFRATLKEVTFTRKMAMLIMRTAIKETMTYANPAMSLFVFCAWMDCIYLDSFGRVPAYVVLFILLHLFRNYALYAIDGPSSRGFIPPTWEEMFLVATSRSCIQPLSMTPRNKDAVIPSPQDKEENLLPIVHKIETHKPLGKQLFRWFGFLESDDILKNMDADERHLEFPFADGKLYPKMSVKEGMATVKEKSTSAGTKKESSSESNRLSKSTHGSMHEKTTKLPTPRRLSLDGNSINTHETETSKPLKFASSGETPRRVRVHTGDMTVYDEDIDYDEPDSSFGEEDVIDDGPTMKPDQDIDFHDNSGGDKKMTDDLNDIKDNLHRLTWHVFHLKTHIIKHPDAAPFGYPKKGNKKKHVNRDLEKVLGVGYYSSYNPLLARVAVYMSPLVDSSLSFLGVFRSLFNIFTWRDPFFSFWVGFFGILLVVVLFFFPWREFMFCFGVFVVGPQNLIFRLIRERGGKNEPDEDTPIEDTGMSHELPTDQQLFKSHAPPNHKHEDPKLELVDPRRVHHVVVPYSPWSNVSNRFSDWPPPNSEYCHVKYKPPTPNHGHSQHKSQLGNSSHHKSQSGSISRHKSHTGNRSLSGNTLGDSSLGSQSNQYFPDGVPQYITAETGPRRRSYSSDSAGRSKIAGTPAIRRQRSYTESTATDASLQPLHRRTTAQLKNHANSC